jgi:hypothetical protein
MHAPAARDDGNFAAIDKMPIHQHGLFFAAAGSLAGVVSAEPRMCRDQVASRGESRCLPFGVKRQEHLRTERCRQSSFNLHAADMLINCIAR